MIKKILIFMIAMIFAAGAAYAAPADVPKTGQTTSYDTGDDGDIKRGVSWPNPRFTDNGNDTVTDNLTSLMWTRDAKAPGPVVCAPGVTKTWQNALNYVACLNTNSYLGYTDWRLPNINELESLIDVERADPALPSGNPFSNAQNFIYWSSTTSAGVLNAINAWAVIMSNGLVGPSSKTLTYYVWPVRAGQ